MLFYNPLEKDLLQFFSITKQACNRSHKSPERSHIVLKFFSTKYPNPAPHRNPVLTVSMLY